MYQGKGAGAHPSASAVVTDIVSLARRLDVPQHNYRPLYSRALPILPMDEVAGCYYLRCRVANRPGVLHAIAGALSQYGVGIATMTQEGHHGSDVPLVITTHRAQEREVQSALAAIRTTAAASVTDVSLLRFLDNLPGPFRS
jgi:homoserine dehydrogenase